MSILSGPCTSSSHNSAQNTHSVASPSPQRTPQLENCRHWTMSTQMTMSTRLKLRAAAAEPQPKEAPAAGGDAGLEDARHKQQFQTRSTTQKEKAFPYRHHDWYPFLNRLWKRVDLHLRRLPTATQTARACRTFLAQTSDLDVDANPTPNRS